MSLNLFDRMATQARQRPDALALQADQQLLSYADLLMLADRCADQLRDRGLGAGAVIGWLGHNEPRMLALLLSCARLGAVLVPLNWRLAAAELADIARHARLSVLLNSDELAPLADQVRALVAGGPGTSATASARAMDDNTTGTTGTAASNGDSHGPQPGDLLLVYTSGTTGAPKGAMHTQAGMLANIDAALAVQPIHADSRVLSVLPLFHVGGLCIQTLPALAAGAAVRLPPRFEPGAWLADVAQWRPTTSLLVPAVMRALIDHPAWAAADLSSLAYVNSGSQVVPLDLINAFHARGVPVAQVYGSTETGPVSIALPPSQAFARGGTVGWPAPGVQVRLVDDADNDVAAGQVGEIWLLARNLMRGYHRAPDHPALQGGWYRTGDLACVSDDGCYQVVGRAKDMIISGGENIYPAEIENLAATWPGVAEAAVVGLPDARWGEVPALALLAQPGATPDLAGLAALLGQRLARFKQPRHTVLLPSLPRTALGKVQKAQLAAMLAEHLAAPVAGQAGQAG